MIAMKLPTWHWPHLMSGNYYGYRFAVIIGPWLIMFGRAKP
jgi:hypothetical protein